VGRCATARRVVESAHGVTQRYADRNMINVFVGRRLPGCSPRSLVDVRVGRLYIDHEPTPAGMVLADFAENLRDRLIMSELITREEFDDLHAALRRHLADPGTT